MKASILAVGTELTTGQIVNKNAAWISKKLKDLGLLTSVHIVVPDERNAISESLQFCADRSEIIFVTGGLGPTSDDFTRELITAWADLPLEFHAPSWSKIKERLESRGFPVQEFQKQQCYFPKNSKILNNESGTANGFQLEAHGKTLFALPGPPKEIETIWNSSVNEWLIAATKNLNRNITLSWDTLGLGESQIATLVEETLKGSDAATYEIGYRVHLPYVEVKFSFFESQRELAEILGRKINSALSEHTVAHNGEDVAQKLADKILSQNVRLEVYDAVTGAFLVNRWLPFVRPLLIKNMWNFSTQNLSHEEKNKSSNALKLFLSPVDEFTVRVGLKKPNGHVFETELKTSIKSELMHERRLQYFSEMALVTWLQNV